MQKILSEMEGKEFSFLKDKLSDCLVATICPVGKKIKELIDDKRYLEQVLSKGREKALKKAEENLKKIREIVGLL
jgi:tryptophanyl-tRNA synthetase